ncbi:TPA: hypothetical protein ACH3X1_000873 [Trebouxia sp. C0004]
MYRLTLPATLLALAAAGGANEHAEDGFEAAEFTTVRHSKGKHVRGRIGRLTAAAVPVKAPDAPLTGPQARKGGVKHTAARAAVNAAVSAAVTEGDRVEEGIPAKPRPGLKAEQAGEQEQECGPDTPDPKGIAESPEPVDPDFPEPIKSRTAVVQPEFDAVLENLLFLFSNAVKQYNENCAGDACIICWNADRGIISLPCGRQATCKQGWGDCGLLEWESVPQELC